MPELTLNELSYGSYPEMFAKLADNYRDLPMDSVIDAFARSGGDYQQENPYIQNRRVKNISSLPAEFDYGKVADMILHPDENEKPLRQVSHTLESTASPYFKIRKTYQDILTYHWYNAPVSCTEEEAKSEAFKREMLLCDKLCRKAKVSETAHMIVGQCVQEGKVFYIFRSDIDKSHNAVNKAYMQQLPQDWVKIVGYNNISKYTVAFDMMYFMQPGTDIRQFGDLFIPYIGVFEKAVSVTEKRGKREKRFVYAQDAKVRKAVNEYVSGDAGTEIYCQNGKWYWWVTLPVDEVWTFEIDDVTRNVAPPLTGLFLAMSNMAKYEQVQLNLVQNPLVAMVLGEIPYRDDNSATREDAYKLSPTGRRLFESYWQQMLARSNTSGVGFYTGPFQNMHLEQLSEAPNSSEISSNGYAYAMQKSGIGIIPATTDPRAGTVQVSLKIETRFAECIYRQMENMMNWQYEKANLNFDWRFRMFGNISDDEKLMKEYRDGMTLGILPSTVMYLALHDMRVSEDMAVSNMVYASGVMDKRLPLVSSYSASNVNMLPPHGEGGRPKAEGVTSEGQEQDIDSEGDEM